jgi:hypothetical protein
LAGMFGLLRNRFAHNDAQPAYRTSTPRLPT